MTYEQYMEYYDFVKIIWWEGGYRLMINGAEKAVELLTVLEYN